MPKGQDLTQLKARKQELMDKEEFWGGMIRAVSRICELPSERESARRLVTEMCQIAASPLGIQKEMIEQGKTFDNTSASICFLEQQMHRPAEEHED